VLIIQLFLHYNTFPIYLLDIQASSKNPSFLMIYVKSMLAKRKICGGLSTLTFFIA
jgi:hypothetical protein